MTPRSSSRLAPVSIWGTGIGILFALTACATTEPSPSPSAGNASAKPATPTASPETPEAIPGASTTGQNSADARTYSEASHLYASQAYPAALSRLENFEKKYPRSALQAQVANLRGLCLLLTKHPDLAIEQFQSALRTTGAKSAFSPYLTYNLAKAQFESGNTDAAEQTAASVDPQKLDADNRLKFHFLKAGIYSKRKFDFEAAKELLVVSKETRNLSPELRKLLESSLDNSLREISGTQQLDDLYRDNQDSPLADALLYRLGLKEKQFGLVGKSESHLRTLLAKYPNSSYAVPAQELLNNKADQIVEHGTVGVLLPLKGKFARFGQRNLEAIEQAFGIFDAGSNSGITLAIEDSGDDAAQAVKALNRLVMKQHVVAVIGPLLSKGIDQVTQRAEELGVPLISLARHIGTTENYVVQAGLTLQLQAYEMARYAIQNRGLRRFAILSPEGQVGDEAAQHFWDAVESMGGQVVGIEHYSPTETDFREVVDKLSGLFYTEARQDELDELARQRKLNQIKKRTRKTEQYFSLPPIVDYDAVFIADDPKISGQILPTFAYRDVEHVQFLGTSAWNSAELISRADKNAEGALFVDAFFPGSQNAKVRKFIETYRSEFGVEPSGMDAIAYDAALVVQKAVQSAGSSSTRADILDKIRSTRNLAGVTGILTYKDGQLSRDLRVLSIQGGQIVEEQK